MKFALRLSHLLIALVSATVSWRICSFFHTHRLVAVLDQNSLSSIASWTTGCRGEQQKSSGTTSPSNKVIQNNDDFMMNYTGPSRVWPIQKDGFPCVPGEERLMKVTPAREGFLFQRPMKVGSTTMIGVVLRLSHNRSPWMKDNIKCKHRAMHGSAFSFEFDKRDRSKSFLFSLLRHPTKRAVSEFFHFGVANTQTEPTDDHFQNWLEAPRFVPRASNRFFENRFTMDMTTRQYTQDMKESDFVNALMDQTEHTLDQIRRIKSIPSKTDKSKAQLEARNQTIRYFGVAPNYTQIVQDILEDYDFIAITERMDESLVVMKMLLNLTTKDILYTKARESGGWSTHTPERPCVRIPPSYVSPGMKQYFASPKWQKVIEGDLLMYRAAYASLDRTIEALGKDLFRKNLNDFKSALEKANDHCEGRVKPACSSGGIRISADENSCYIWGEACDYECLNDLEL